MTSSGWLCAALGGCRKSIFVSVKNKQSIMSSYYAKTVSWNLEDLSTPAKAFEESLGVGNILFRQQRSKVR